MIGVDPPLPPRPPLLPLAPPPPWPAAPPPVPPAEPAVPARDEAALYPQPPSTRATTIARGRRVDRRMDPPEGRGPQQPEKCPESPHLITAPAGRALGCAIERI